MCLPFIFRAVCFSFLLVGVSVITFTCATISSVVVDKTTDYRGRPVVDVCVPVSLCSFPLAAPEGILPRAVFVSCFVFT